MRILLLFRRFLKLNITIYVNICQLSIKNSVLKPQVFKNRLTF